VSDFHLDHRCSNDHSSTNTNTHQSDQNCGSNI
jgi:hypothetical protein